MDRQFVLFDFLNIQLLTIWSHSQQTIHTEANGVDLKRKWSIKTKLNCQCNQSDSTISMSCTSISASKLKYESCSPYNGCLVIGCTPNPHRIATYRDLYRSRKNSQYGLNINAINGPKQGMFGMIDVSRAVNSVLF